MTGDRLRRASLWVVLLAGLFSPRSGGAEESTAPAPYCPVIEECVADYVAFPLVAPDPSSPLPTGEFARLLDRMDHQKEPLLTSSPVPGGMRPLILDGLNIRALVQGAGQAVPDARFGTSVDRPSLRETEVFIDDPFVGIHLNP